MVTGSGAVGLPPVISVIIVTSVGPALSDTESGSIRTTRCAAEVSSSSSVTAAAVTARDPGITVHRQDLVGLHQRVVHRSERERRRGLRPPRRDGQRERRRRRRVVRTRLRGVARRAHRHAHRGRPRQGSPAVERRRHPDGRRPRRLPRRAPAPPGGPPASGRRPRSGPSRVSVAVTGDVVPETRRLTVNVSSSSSTASSMVGTVNVRVSPARPAKRTGCPAAR